VKINILFILLCFTFFKTQAQIYSCSDVSYDVTVITGKDTLQNFVSMDCPDLPYEGRMKTFGNINNTKSVEWKLYNDKNGERTQTPFEKFNRYLIEDNEQLCLPFLLSIDPRSKIYGSLLYYPHPYVRFPLEVGKTWGWESDEISIYESHSSFGIRSHGTSEHTIKAVYTVKQKLNWYYEKESKQIECYEIEAIGKLLYETMTLLFYYSPEYGFVYIEYIPISEKEAADIFQTEFSKLEEKVKTMSFEEERFEKDNFFNTRILQTFPPFYRYKFIFEMNNKTNCKNGR